MIERQQQNVDQLDPVVGQRVRELREARAWSQSDLAHALEQRGLTWHQTTVAKVEAGRRTIKASEALALAYALQIPVEKLLDPDNLDQFLDANFFAGQQTELRRLELYLERRQREMVGSTAEQQRAIEGAGDGEHREEA